MLVEILLKEESEAITMKKNILIKTMGMAMVCALVVGNAGLVVHAAFNDDGCYAGNGLENGGSSASDGSDDIGGGSFNSGNSESSSSGGSSHDSSYYDDGAYHGNGLENGGSSASDGSDNIGASSSVTSYSASAPKAAGGTASAGKEQFRALAKAGSGTYKVTHKGVEIATFTLMDADKKAVSCTKVALKKRDDGKYAINYEVADATDLTVGAPLDRTYMYNTLGISYITINDTVIIDIEAEAAAKTTK